MSASADLQEAVEGCLRLPGALREAVEILRRRPKELASDIAAAAASKDLCIWIMPPLPTRVTQGVPFVFVEAAELRVRVLEQIATNDAAADAYDLVDDVMNALQWQPHRSLGVAVQARMTAASEDTATASAWVQAQPEFAGLVGLGRILTAHPLELASRPVEMFEGRLEGVAGITRMIDVIFTATYGFAQN